MNKIQFKLQYYKNVISFYVVLKMKKTFKKISIQFSYKSLYFPSGLIHLTLPLQQHPLPIIKLIL